MTKFSIAIMALIVALGSSGPLTRHKRTPDPGKQMAPTTIQADFPFPTCPPACALPTPNHLPD